MADVSNYHVFEKDQIFYEFTVNLHLIEHVAGKKKLNHKMII